jgi:hypothetical protein
MPDDLATYCDIYEREADGSRGVHAGGADDPAHAIALAGAFYIASQAWAVDTNRIVEVLNKEGTMIGWVGRNPEQAG